MRISDWSSDVCSSDLIYILHAGIDFIHFFDALSHQLLGAEHGAMRLHRLLHFQTNLSGRRTALRVMEMIEAGQGPISCIDRKSVVSGKSVSVRVDIGGSRHLKKKTHSHQTR